MVLDRGDRVALADVDRLLTKVIESDDSPSEASER